MPAPVYVIVLNWNGEVVLGACLGSLARVSEPALRIIVVDNASTDHSVEMVRRDFPGVELVVNRENLLFAAGNNVGLERAMAEGAERMLLLNNDTEVRPDFAARMTAVMDADPRAGIVGPKIFYYDDPRRIWYGGGGFWPLIGVPRHLNIRRLDGTFPERAGETGYVTGCAMLIRREVIERIGLLDPAYRMYSEDVDFCLRARRAGWTCLYEPSAVVWHKVSSSSGGGLTPYKVENRVASTQRLLKRFKPLWWRVLLFPVHLVAFAGLLAALACTRRRKLASAALRGAVRAMRGE
jgi:GT2 family glycosyltransferase